MEDNLEKMHEAALKQAYSDSISDSDKERHRAIAAEFARRDPTSRRAKPQI